MPIRLNCGFILKTYQAAAAVTEWMVRGQVTPIKRS